MPSVSVILVVTYAFRPALLCSSHPVRGHRFLRAAAMTRLVTMTTRCPTMTVPAPCQSIHVQ